MENDVEGVKPSMLKSRAEVTPVLQALIEHDASLVSYLSGGETVFKSKLRKLDPAGEFILIDGGNDDLARAALLGLGRCIFHATVEGWRIEFVCADPREHGSGAKPIIQLRYPEVLSRWQRAHERAQVAPGVPLQCVADAGGIMPFEGLIVDIGPEGLGFLIHSPSITLEPGTVLKSCAIEIPGRPPCKVDLEVCYSQPMVLGDGTRSLRSGCRFIDSGGSFSANQIKVVTEGSAVYLLGLVTRKEAQAAVEIARTTGGVQKVVRVFEYIEAPAK